MKEMQGGSRDHQTKVSLDKLRGDNQCPSEVLRKDAEESCSDHKPAPKCFGESKLPKAIISGATSKTPNVLFEIK